MPYAEELAGLLKLYLVVGGMPEAVGVYVETGNLRKVREIQDEILSAYDSDFVKHAAGSAPLQTATGFDIIPLVKTIKSDV